MVRTLLHAVMAIVKCHGCSFRRLHAASSRHRAQEQGEGRLADLRANDCSSRVTCAGHSCALTP